MTKKSTIQHHQSLFGKHNRIHWDSWYRLWDKISICSCSWWFYHIGKRLCCPYRTNLMGRHQWRHLQNSTVPLLPLKTKNILRNSIIKVIINFLNQTICATSEKKWHLWVVTLAGWLMSLFICTRWKRVVLTWTFAIHKLSSLSF